MLNQYKSLDVNYFPEKELVVWKIVTEGIPNFTMEALTGKKLLVIIHEVEHTELRAYPLLNSLINSIEGQVGVAAITASNGAAFESLSHDVQLAIPYYYSDKTLLKTMIRSNPGLVLLQDGEVIKKWHYNDIPDAYDLLNELN